MLKGNSSMPAKIKVLPLGTWSQTLNLDIFSAFSTRHVNRRKFIASHWASICVNWKPQAATSSRFNTGRMASYIHPPLNWLERVNPWYRLQDILSPLWAKYCRKTRFRRKFSRLGLLCPHPFPIEAKFGTYEWTNKFRLDRCIVAALD